MHFTSSDAQAVLPADASLTGGMGTFSVTLRTAGNQTLSASSSAVTGSVVSASVQVTPGAVSQFLVSVPTAAAGATVTTTVTAEDAFGNVATGYTGKVVWKSSDAQATLPAAYTFQTSDKGAHAFAVVLRTAGTQTVTATDSQSANVKGTASVVVTAAAASRLSVTSKTTTATAGASVAYTVTAQDAFGNTASSYLGVVQFSSSDAHAVLPAPLTFAKSDGGVKQFTVAFHTAGTQTVSLTDKTAHLTGSATTTVQAGAASKLLLTGPTAVKAGIVVMYTLTAVDAFGNVATGYRGIVRWQSSDAKATLPSQYTFTAADKGSHTFSITFMSKKSQSLTAADTVSAGISGSESGIVVS